MITDHTDATDSTDEEFLISEIRVIRDVGQHQEENAGKQICCGNNRNASHSDTKTNAAKQGELTG